jgi:hypothetical protein
VPLHYKSTMFRSSWLSMVMQGSDRKIPVGWISAAREAFQGVGITPYTIVIGIGGKIFKFKSVQEEPGAARGDIPKEVWGAETEMQV